MTDRHDASRPESAAGWQGARWDKDKTPASGSPASDGSPLTRFLGGSPLAVLIRLVLMSLVVGALLVWLDIHPREIFWTFERLAYRLWHMGFDAVREIASYILAGAAIVVPIWLLLRLMNMRSK